MNVCLAVAGSVPDVQFYDADNDTYTPDYTLTPLIIQPSVSRLDKDEILSPGSVNQSLANIRWYEIVGGTRKLIDATNADYEITTSGGTAGRIKVMRNAQTLIPITLEFNADYTDARTNQIHQIKQTCIIMCKNATAHIPVLILDAAQQTLYNPLKDSDTQIVTASLKLADEECPAGNRLFVWEIFREDGTWTAVGTETTMDFDVSVSEDTASCTVNRKLMGEDLFLRCRAKYDVNGNPASVALTGSAPQRIVSFVRRIPKFEYDITGVPTNIPAGILAIAPEAKVWDTNGPIPDFEKELLPLWYVATNKESGSLSYSLVGHGASPTLKTNPMNQLYGAVFGLEVKDVGPDSAWTDSDGAVFVDGDGNIILIK